MKESGSLESFIYMDKSVIETVIAMIFLTLNLIKIQDWAPAIVAVHIPGIVVVQIGSPIVAAIHTPK